MAIAQSITMQSHFVGKWSPRDASVPLEMGTAVLQASAALPPLACLPIGALVLPRVVVVVLHPLQLLKRCQLFRSLFCSSVSHVGAAQQVVGLRILCVRLDTLVEGGDRFRLPSLENQYPREEA